MIMDIFKRKKPKNDFPTEVTTELPEDLERFRTRRIEPMPPRNNFPGPMDFEPERRSDSKEKIDLVLQKLETIDLRLKLLEEKLGV
jgi:hypothetical protein